MHKVISSLSNYLRIVTMSYHLLLLPNKLLKLYWFLMYETAMQLNNNTSRCLSHNLQMIPQLSPSTSGSYELVQTIQPSQVLTQSQISIKT